MSYLEHRIERLEHDVRILRRRLAVAMAVAAALGATTIVACQHTSDPPRELVFDDGNHHAVRIDANGITIDRGNATAHLGGDDFSMKSGPLTITFGQRGNDGLVSVRNADAAAEITVSPDHVTQRVVP